MDFIGLFKCTFCQSRFHDAETLITHFAAEHLNTKLYECENCNLSFVNTSDYYEHRNSSISNCGQFGVTLKSFFNLVNSAFQVETTKKIEPEISNICNSPVPPAFIKSEIINHDENVLDDFFSEEKQLNPFSNISDNFVDVITKSKSDVESENNLIECEDDTFIPETNFDQESSSSSSSDEEIPIKRRRARTKKIIKKSQPVSRRKKLLVDGNKIKTEILDNDTLNIKEEKIDFDETDNENSTNKCKVCGKSFENREKLRKHLESHGIAQNQPHNCTICSKVFNTYVGLTTHINSKHSKEPFCSICNIKFLNQDDFRAHRSEMHKIKRNRKREPKNLECFECVGKIFTRVSTFVMHLANKHKKSDSDIKNIVELNNETFKTDLMCKICAKLFSSFEHFLKHQKIKHGIDGSKKYKCKSCPEFFTTPEEVKSHTIELHKEQLMCNICNNGKIYACIESLTSHRRKMHGGGVADQNSSDDPTGSRKQNKIYKFICGQCGKIMYGRTQFKNHEASNCGKNPVHKCHVCGKGFCSAGTLKGHVSIHADYESFEYVCEFCQKRYRSKHQLEKHRRVHTGERPFQCPHCERAFGTSAALFVHVSTHTGIKRYMCTCGERFSCITGLKGHWKTNITTCGSDPNRSTKPVGEYIGYRKGKIVNIRPEDEMMMRPST